MMDCRTCGRGIPTGSIGHTCPVGYVPFGESELARPEIAAVVDRFVREIDYRQDVRRLNGGGGDCVWCNEPLTVDHRCNGLPVLIS